MYYAEYPYILRSPLELKKMEEGRWKRSPAIISSEGLAAWKDAIGDYQSQISTFWKSMDEARLAIANYWAGGGGRLWSL
jgi:hypothetical protein